MIPTDSVKNSLVRADHSSPRLSAKGSLSCSLVAGFLLAGASAQTTTKYGVEVDLMHSAAYNGAANTSSVEISADEQVSLSYDNNPQEAIGAFGSANSNHYVEISPGVLKFGWIGAATIENGVGNLDAFGVSEATVQTILKWEETFTVTSDDLPSGTQTQFSYNGDLRGSIGPAFELNHAPLNTSGRVDLFLVINSSFGESTLQFTITDSDDDDRSGSKTFFALVGEEITLEMIVTVFGVVGTQVAVGEPVDEPKASLWIDGVNSARFGIEALTPGAGLSTASGRTYPSSATDAADVQMHLSNLAIKRVAHDHVEGTHTFVLDAIPEAFYILQRSQSMKPGTWQNVMGPTSPLEAGELVLTDTGDLGPTEFWRVVSSPVE